MKLFFLAVALWATPLFAQAGAALVRPDGQVAAAIPDEEKPRKMADTILRMRVVLREVLAKLEEARKSKDVVKLNCVNEKLTQIKGLIRISEQSDLNLQQSMAMRDKQGMDHELTKVGIARSKVEQLRAEAEQCIGELAYRADENLLVEVDIPNDLPILDPTRPGDMADVTLRQPAPGPPTFPDPLVPQPPASPVQ
jgi:hypothetical protein